MPALPTTGGPDVAFTGPSVSSATHRIVTFVRGKEPIASRHPIPESSVPTIRVRPLGGPGGEPAAVRADGDFVLYWMIASRRHTWSFPLERAAEWARELDLPLVVLEEVRLSYPWASDRLHRFMIDGMVERVRSGSRTGAVYYPFVERTEGEGAALYRALSARAAVVVSEDYPAFFLPEVQRKLASQSAVRFELVDGNGLLPIRSSDKVFSRAYDFRRFLQRHLPEHLGNTPRADPLEGGVPQADSGLLEAELARWPRLDPAWAGSPDALPGLPIDHEVAPVGYDGGPGAARRALRRFLTERLDGYADGRRHPDAGATSELSPYLHFGHVSVHEVFDELAAAEGWTPDRLADGATGGREGWWGMSESAEAFLDELVTWREIGFNMNAKRDDYDRYESLPDWARETLEEHEVDERPHLYSLDEFAAASTHDPVWNAAQRELLGEGRIHGYMRMLWGKKILEWTATAREALAVMIELNNRYATDGRDPNSYSGIFWVLGRYDRPWPEREVFGKVRTMTSASTKKKLRLSAYLERFGPEAG